MQAHCLGMAEGRMRRSGGGRSHGGTPPKLLKCSFHNGSGFVKERNAQVNVSFIPCLTKIKLEREEMPMSIVFRALLRGQEWFRYSSFYFSCWGRA